MHVKKPEPLPTGSGKAVRICEVCGQASYSASGIHPQCAQEQADARRVARIKAEDKAVLVRGRSVIVLIIITIGVSIVLRGAAMLLFGKDTYSLAGFSGGEPIAFLGASLLPQNLWVGGITLCTLVAMKLYFDRTISGKAMLACACDRKAASLMGINVDTMVTL